MLHVLRRGSAGTMLARARSRSSAGSSGTAPAAVGMVLGSGAVDTGTTDAGAADGSVAAAGMGSVLATWYCRLSASSVLTGGWMGRGVHTEA